VAPLWVVPILLVPAAILAADVLYRLVEAPGIGWGKQISRHMSARLPLPQKADASLDSNLAYADIDGPGKE
jgi:peptidoglycan/LPS O-acetylase OafA/YrhL